VNSAIYYSRYNAFNYINMTNPDVSGMLRFLTDELQDAENAGDRGTFISLSRNLFDRCLKSGSWDMFSLDGTVLIP
jgi:hypothetical protein